MGLEYGDALWRMELSRVSCGRMLKRMYDFRSRTFSENEGET